uniref:Uncharacterized protein n=1 Tax=Quercus lobata TaxID=97700 RepID=A0A7N2MP27_QUELO
MLTRLKSVESSRMAYTSKQEVRSMARARTNTHSDRDKAEHMWIANAVRVLSILGFNITIEVIRDTMNLSSSLNLDIHEMLGSEFCVLVAEGEAEQRSLTKKKG